MSTQELIRTRANCERRSARPTPSAQIEGACDGSLSALPIRHLAPAPPLAVPLARPQFHDVRTRRAACGLCARTSFQLPSLCAEVGHYQCANFLGGGPWGALTEMQLVLHAAARPGAARPVLGRELRGKPVRARQLGAQRPRRGRRRAQAAGAGAQRVGGVPVGRGQGRHGDEGLRLQEVVHRRAADAVPHPARALLRRAEGVRQADHGGRARTWTARCGARRCGSPRRAARTSTPRTTATSGTGRTPARRRSPPTSSATELLSAAAEPSPAATSSAALRGRRCRARARAARAAEPAGARCAAARAAAARRQDIVVHTVDSHKLG